MFNIAFRLQLIILELRRNLRYWVMLIPLVTLLLFPLFYWTGGFAYTFTLDKSLGAIAIQTPLKDNINIITDEKKSVELINGKKLFITRINNRDNLTYGFRKLIYQIQFLDENQQEIDQDNTKYQDFMLPGEVFYVSHTASKKAQTMNIKFLLKESNLVNVLQESVKKFDRKVAELSNLTIDTSASNVFSINFLINNLSGKTLKNLKYQYVIGDKVNNNLYLGNLTFTEIKDFDQTPKSVTDISYPVGVNKSELQYLKEKNNLRYNFLEYEE
jgi:hypothetical protein